MKNYIRGTGSRRPKLNRTVCLLMAGTLATNQASLANSTNLDLSWNVTVGERGYISCSSASMTMDREAFLRYVYKDGTLPPLVTECTIGTTPRRGTERFTRLSCSLDNVAARPVTEWPSLCRRWGMSSSSTVVVDISHSLYYRPGNNPLVQQPHTYYVTYSDDVHGGRPFKEIKDAGVIVGVNGETATRFSMNVIAGDTHTVRIGVSPAYNLGPDRKKGAERLANQLTGQPLMVLVLTKLNLV